MSDRGNDPIRDLPPPPVITIASRPAVGPGLGRINSGLAASGANPFAIGDMLAFSFVITAPTPIAVVKAFWCNGTAAGGNYATAIYDADFVKIVQSASTGGSGNSVPQSVAMAAKIPAGLYYAALASDSATTQRLFRWSASAPQWKAFGCWRQASVTLATLPNPATPVACTNVGFPVFGLITRTVFDV